MNNISMLQNKIHFTRCRIIPFIIIFVCSIFGAGKSFGQTPTDGDYRTMSSGLWNGLTTWQVRVAGVWTNTATPPTTAANIFIQSGHNLTVNISPADCKDLNIHTSGIVTIGANILQVSGKLRAYTGTAVVATGPDGTFYSQGISSSPPDAMLTTTGGGLLKFIGASRNLTVSGEWGASNGVSHATEFALNIGATGNLPTGYKSSKITITSGIIDMDILRLALDNGNANQGDITIEANGTLISGASGGAGSSVMSRTGSNRAGTFTLNGKLVLSGASPEIQFSTISINPGSTIEYARAGSQNFVAATMTGAVGVNTYANLALSGSAMTNNKTPNGNFAVTENVSITGSASLVMSTLTATVGGNWTSYGTAGLTENTSTIDFNGTGNQVINTTGGEDFFKMKKSGSGTLTMNSDVKFAGTSSELNISAGIMDAGTNTLSGTTATAFIMTAGTLKLGKLLTNLPEMAVTSFTLSGTSTIELNGAGSQTLLGNRSYRNLSFSNSGTKTVTSAPSSITGSVTIANTAVLDVANNTFGDNLTSLVMTGTSRLINGGSGVRPTMSGTYSLASGTTIEFSLGSATEIRISSPVPNYSNVIVSGTNVSLSTTTASIPFQAGGSFTVKNGGVFKVINVNGFSGSAFTAIDFTNNPLINLETNTPGNPNSTIEYSGTNQPITNQTINTPANANYVNLTLSGGTGTIKTAPATLTIKGNLVKTGATVFAHNDGNVVFNGAAGQAYNATAPVMDFYNLTNNNLTVLAINNDLTVANELAFATNAILDLEDANITLKSNAGNTANIGKLLGTANILYNGTGAFTVERYIPSGIAHLKSWQFVTAPVIGQTIRQSWMENGLIISTPNGYGTWITAQGAGFDAVTSTPSMKTYVPASDTWTTVGNPVSTAINNADGYMLFVRGDRSVFNFSGGNSAAVKTTLRAKGALLKGDQSVAVNAGQFRSIANPYASAIDLTQLVLNESGGGVQDFFYVWDPLLTTVGVNSVYGFGGFQTFSKTGGTYTVVPGGGSYGSTSKIVQSGQAFLMHAVATNGSVKFTEACKVGGSSVVNRPGNNISLGKELRTNLYVMKNNIPILLDGNIVQYDAGYSNVIDRQDGFKMSNAGENFGLFRSATTLVVESRAPIQVADTVFYRMDHFKTQNYLLEFIPASIARRGLTATLEDNFLGTKTAISLMDTTRIPFAVNDDAGSYATDRFRIVFRQLGNPSQQDHQETISSQHNITVYPNPVTDKTMRVFFNDQPAGNYTVQVFSQSGQLMLEKRAAVPGNNYVTAIRVNAVASGTYQLVITGSDGNRNIQQVIIK